jgi:hypothetical protein
MSEPLKSFISKVGTFRGKGTHKDKSGQQHPSLSNLRFGEADESVLRAHDENIMHTSNGSGGAGGDCDLDTTAKSFGSGTLTRSSHQQPQPIAVTSMYDSMTPEQINEEFEKSLLVSISDAKTSNPVLFIIIIVFLTRW